ncbi:MAG: hypothetical protein ACLQPH_16295 [Acidimicrobiales bacterium]
MVVVVLDLLAEDLLQVAASEDEHSVETLSANRADESLGEGIGPSGTDWCADDPDVLRAEDLVEAVGERLCCVARLRSAVHRAPYGVGAD